MTADDFVSRLRAAQPTRISLRSAGVPEEIIDEIRASYCFVRRQRPQGLQGHDPVIDLLDRYDASTVDIGSIKFRATPQPQRCRDGIPVLIFADFEADALALDDSSHQIWSLDGCKLSFVMMTLAQDGGRFFDALIYLVETKGTSVESGQIARRCAELAGSDAAIGFYQMLVG